MKSKRTNFLTSTSESHPTKQCLRIYATLVRFRSPLEFDEEDKRKDSLVNTRNDPLHFDSQVKTDVRDSIVDPEMSINHPTGGNVDSSIEAMHGFLEYDSRASGRQTTNAVGERNELATNYVKNLLNM